MKKLLICLFAILFTSNSWGSGIGADATSATCDNNTLGAYNGTVSLEVNWIPNDINVQYYDNNTKLSAPATCSFGGDLSLPATPTKKGYTFKGWELKYTIPAEYTELQYIQGTGTQWIDTGYAWTTANAKLDFEWETILTPALLTVIGSSSTTNDSNWFVMYSANSYSYYWALGSGNRFTGSTYERDKKYHTILETKSDGSCSQTINGVTTNSTYTGDFINQGNVFLYTMSYTHSTYWLNKGGLRFYSVKMYDNKILVRNLIPARRNSDGEIGMYDTVTKTFFTNSGSGTFVAGPDM